MTGSTSMEEQLRKELDRMRAEVRAEHPAPKRVLARARRAVTATLAGAALTVALVVTGSVAAWRTFGVPDGSSIGLAGEGPNTGTTGPVATPSPTIEDLSAGPLALPSVAPGATCPTTATTAITPGSGAGFSEGVVLSPQKAGPVYLWSGRTVTLSPESRTADGWYTIKDIWLVDPSYSGPVLIRGGRVEGEGSLKLQWNPTTPVQDALQIDATSPSLQTNPSIGWRSVPLGALVRSRGCYAYQVDGVGFTEWIVFEASD